MFDLLSVCLWDEFALNIGPLIQLCKDQLGVGELPLILPFHSLHYPMMDKNTMKSISEAYAKDAEKKALCSLSQSQSRGKKKAPQENLRRSASPFSSGGKTCFHMAPRGTQRCGTEGEQAMDGRLRIGYVSSDFVNHPTADLLQSPLLQHDKDRFDVFCFSTGHPGDESEYRRAIERWVPGHHDSALRMPFSNLQAGSRDARRHICISLLPLNGLASGPDL